MLTFLRILFSEELEIQDFIDLLSDFKYYELNINFTSWGKNFNFKSINNI